MRTPTKLRLRYLLTPWIFRALAWISKSVLPRYASFAALSWQLSNMTGKLSLLLSSGLCLFLLGCVTPPVEAGAESVINVEYRYRGRVSGVTHFSLNLMSDGAVIFEGFYGTRVSGIAKSTTDKVRIQKWLESLVATGVLSRKDSPIPADGGWIRLTVNAASNQNTYKFSSTSSLSPTRKILNEIFQELQVFETWVLYNKID